MPWWLESAFGLRWVLPYLLALSSGGTNCEAVWIDQDKPGSYRPRNSAYMDVPAVLCDCGQDRVVCTSLGCWSWP